MLLLPPKFRVVKEAFLFLDFLCAALSIKHRVYLLMLLLSPQIYGDKRSITCLSNFIELAVAVTVSKINNQTNYQPDQKPQPVGIAQFCHQIKTA